MLTEAAYLQNIGLYPVLQDLSLRPSEVSEYFHINVAAGYTVVAASRAIDGTMDSMPKTVVILIVQIGI